MPTNYPDGGKPGVPILDLGSMPVVGCKECRIRPATYHGICNECKKEYMKAYSQKRYDARRQRIIDFHRARCSTCGKTIEQGKIVIKAAKEFEGDGKNYSKCYTWKKADFEDAIAKCRLLCMSCQGYETQGFDLKLEMLRIWGEEKKGNETQL